MSYEDAYLVRVNLMRMTCKRTALAIRCRACVGERYCCVECQPELEEWTKRVLHYDPPWMRVKSGNPSEVVVR